MATKNKVQRYTEWKRSLPAMSNPWTFKSTF